MYYDGTRNSFDKIFPKEDDLGIHLRVVTITLISMPSSEILVESPDNWFYFLIITITPLGASLAKFELS